MTVRRTAVSERSTASSLSVSTWRRTRRPATSQVVHAGQARQPVGRAREFGGDARTGQVAQLGERAGLHRPAPADDAHPVAERLDLAEDVRRRAAPCGRYRAPPRTQRWKTSSISGSSPEVGSSRISSVHVGGERGDQGDLLAVALGVGAALLVGSSSKRSTQVGAPGRSIQAARAAGRSRSMTSPPERFAPQRHVAGYVRDVPVQLDRVLPRVAAEQLGRARVGAQQAEQDPDGGRLARRRWGRGSRGPHRSRRRGRARRGRACARTTCAVRRR